MEFINLLNGREEDVILNIQEYYKKLLESLPPDIAWISRELIINSVIVLKRLKGDNANILDLVYLLNDSSGIGRSMALEFTKISAKPGIPEILKKENDDVANYFLSNYFNEKGQKYSQCAAIRARINCDRYFYRNDLIPEVSLSEAEEFFNKD